MPTMYDLIFPDTRRVLRVALMLRLLDVPRSSVPLLRDAWAEATEPTTTEVVLYTKANGLEHDHAGGFVKDGCKACLRDALTADPKFLRFAEDGPSSPYGSFYFSLPENLHPSARAVLGGKASRPLDMNYIWHRRLDHIQDDENE